MIVNLSNDPLWDHAWRVGERRAVHHIRDRAQHGKPKPRVKDRWTRTWRDMTEQELIARDATGCIAEAVVARVLGGTWNEGIGEEHWGGDDVVLHCGDVVEVKSSLYPTAMLFVYPEQDAEHLTLLAIPDVNSRTVRLAGWQQVHLARAAGVWNPKRLKPVHELRQDQLRPVSELLTILEDHACLPPSP